MLEPLVVQPDELRTLAAEVDGVQIEIAFDATDTHLAGAGSLVAGSLVAGELSKVDASLLIALSEVVDQLATFGAPRPVRD
ncbi:hypothetical protein CH249_01310 [Rhodococcus sp. 05-2255-3B1]|nr:hypothetical protein CH250_06050 [Rhodococcus sp. 05-2255-3C]OZE15921.1 hypothetical protein CH249_01310 [Rhodococcus sp. 05-2255-3B1]OZE18960.1 hypothetical protein CH255_13335 [Rhodococcus sp. 05-2255-2A2]